MRRSCLFLLISSLWLLVSPVGANTLLSENFDELTPWLGVNLAGAFSAVGGTNVDVVGGGLYGFLCAGPESGNCIDLDGSGGNSQGILQSNQEFQLLPGNDYFLNFDLIGSERGVTTSTTVDFGPYSQTFVLASGDETSGVVTNQLVTVSEPTLTYLTFKSNTPGQIGAVLDNVVLTDPPASAPEPSYVALATVALLGLSLFARSRKVRL